MAPLNPPQYLQTGSYTARSDRLMTAAMVTPSGIGSLDVRSGVKPGQATGSLAVAQQVTPAMSVTVAAGSAWIQSQSASGGCYAVVNDAAYTVAITTAHATLGRRDLIVARVYDAEITGALNQWTLEIVTGTPAGSPVAPAVPAGAMKLATVLVGAAVTSISNANITDSRVFTTPVGGTVPAPASSLPTNPYVGQPTYDTTNLRPLWHNGTAWQYWMDDPGIQSIQTQANSLQTQIDYLTNPPRALMNSPTPTSIPASIFTVLGWGGEDYDNNNGHSTVSNTSRYTVQTAGRFEYLAYISWSIPAAGQREVYVRKNGTTDLRVSYVSTASGSVQGSMICQGDALLIVGDYLEVRLYQATSGSGGVDSSSGSTFFKVKWIGTT